MILYSPYWFIMFYYGLKFNILVLNTPLQSYFFLLTTSNYPLMIFSHSLDISCLVTDHYQSLTNIFQSLTEHIICLTFTIFVHIDTTMVKFNILMHNVPLLSYIKLLAYIHHILSQYRNCPPWSYIYIRNDPLWSSIHIIGT